ncbi:tryptophan 5-hydroxylase 1-like [Symsagittifera roscoffensis]|uniref:tryptophan 5-hydroxylase 1-like n=1 Tax=Symsagittifera roscoffensis TaxID=84072 RepID=UPI00307BE172
MHWATVYSELKSLYVQHACREYLVNLPLLELYCGYGDAKVPQLNTVNNFLMEKTGFSLRPVAGYLSSRDFLSALAFRVFCCTQYIRHASDPFYTPEPDCCHELLGHVPMLADRTFCDFSQEIGLASLGASDPDVEKLSKLYFFTVEFGLCRQDGQVKIYGAGLLSSVGELKHSMEDVTKQKDFSLEGILDMNCNITSFQDNYFINSSFTHAKQQVRNFTNSIQRGFEVKYNPYTRSVDVMKTTIDYIHALNQTQQDMNLLIEGMQRHALNNTSSEKRVGVNSDSDWTQFIDNLCPPKTYNDSNNNKKNDDGQANGLSNGSA